MPTLADLLRTEYSIAPEISDGQGLKFYGARFDSPTIKGSGWFGPMQANDGDVATELSGHTERIGDYPLIAPTIDKKQLASLLRGEQPSEETYINAENWAKARLAQGLSPFAQPNELTLANVQGLNPNRLKGGY